jgi:hypothetical protein
MLNNIFNCLFNKKNKKNKKRNEISNELSEINNDVLNILIDSCVNLYEPESNNYLQIQTKFHIEYINTFNDINNYTKYKQILFDKMLEKKIMLKAELKIFFFIAYI